MKVKKLDLKDQSSIARNLKNYQEKACGSDETHLWRRARAAIAIMSLDEEGGHLADPHCGHSDVPAFNHLWGKMRKFCNDQNSSCFHLALADVERKLVSSVPR